MTNVVPTMRHTFAVKQEDYVLSKRLVDSSMRRQSLDDTICHGRSIRCIVICSLCRDHVLLIQHQLSSVSIALSDDRGGMQPTKALIVG